MVLKELNRIEIGIRFGVLREKLGLTLAQLAEKVNTSAGYLSEIENGKKKPSVDIISALAKLHPNKIFWLLTGEGANEIGIYDEDQRFGAPQVVAESPPPEYKTEPPELTRLKVQMERIYKGRDKETIATLRGFLAALDPGEKGG